MSVGTAIARIVSKFEQGKVSLPPQGFRSGAYETSQSLLLPTEGVCSHFAFVLSRRKRL